MTCTFGKWLKLRWASSARLGFNLVRKNISTRTDQLRQDRAVVAGAGADVENRVADLGLARGKTARVQAGLTVVNVAIGQESDEHILIQNPGVIDNRVNISRGEG